MDESIIFKKICIKCKEEKPRIDFPCKRTGGNICRKCKNKDTMDRYHKSERGKLVTSQDRKNNRHWGYGE